MSDAMKRRAGEIQARAEEYVLAHNRGDAAGAAGVYALDGTHTYAMGFADRGREAIEARLRDLFAGPWNGLQLSLRTVALRFLSDTIAVAEEEFEVAGLRGPEGDDLDPVRGFTLIVWTERDGRWQVAAGQGMVPLRPGEAGS